MVLRTIDLLWRLGLLAAMLPAWGVDLPPGVVREAVVTDLLAPTALAWSKDGRLFIAQQSGLVRVVERGELLPTPFIDLRAVVNSHFYRGLVGIVPHPDFPTTPHVYLSHTWDFGDLPADSAAARASRVVRVSVDPGDPNVALPDSLRVVLGGGGSPDQVDCTDDEGFRRDCLPSEAPIHTITTLRFGPDGALFVGNGDGTYLDADPTLLRAQALDSLAGKLLRIDPDSGLGLPDNPFFDGDPASNRSRVYSFGFRNPYRFFIHPDSGLPVIGEVGSDRFEEINIATPGANFGWPCYEGDTGLSVVQPAFEMLPGCQALYAEGIDAVTAPYYAFSHEVMRTIVMGNINPGDSLGASERGRLFLGDFTLNYIRSLDLDAPVAGAQRFAEAILAPVYAAFGPDSHLYYVDSGFGTRLGGVYRLRLGDANSRPIAVLRADRTLGALPLQVHFSAHDSYDADGDVLQYRWDFGDGSTPLTTSIPEASHRYTTAFNGEVTLTVSDGTASAEDSFLIQAGNRSPTAQITVLTAVDYAVGDTIDFAGDATDPEEGFMPPQQLRWSLRMRQGQGLFREFQTFSGYGGRFTVPDVGDLRELALCLSAGDREGLLDQVCRFLSPRLITLTLASEPPGRTIMLGSARYSTPATVQVLQGASRRLTVPMGEDGQRFLGWEDAVTSAERQIVADGNTQRYTARYQVPTNLWRSYQVTMAAEAAVQAQVADVMGGPAAELVFYEVASSDAIPTGTPYTTYNPGPLPEGYNLTERYWANGSGIQYGYVGKSQVDRGIDEGEMFAPPPLGVRDLQMHPPIPPVQYTVAAFVIPRDGQYRLTDLGLRRVSSISGGNELRAKVNFRVFDNAGMQRAVLTATDQRGWVSDHRSLDFGILTAGERIYFAMDGDADFAFDAAEVRWAVARQADDAPSLLVQDGFEGAINLP